MKNAGKKVDIMNECFPMAPWRVPNRDESGEAMLQKPKPNLVWVLSLIAVYAFQKFILCDYIAGYCHDPIRFDGILLAGKTAQGLFG